MTWTFLIERRKNEKFKHDSIVHRICRLLVLLRKLGCKQCIGLAQIAQDRTLPHKIFRFSYCQTRWHAPGITCHLDY